MTDREPRTFPKGEELLDILQRGRRFTEDLLAENERLRFQICLLYTSPSPRDRTRSRMPSSA